MTDAQVKHMLSLKEAGCSWREIERKLNCGLNHIALRKAYSRLGKGKKIDAKETLVYNQGNYESEKVIPLSEEDKKNPRSILLAHSFDPSEWELVYAKHSAWDTQLKGGDTRQFYSSRITARPKRTVDAIDVLKMLEDAKPRGIPRERTEKGGRVLELSLADIHLGRLCWAGTAGESFDTDIGIQRVRNVISKVVARMDGEHFSEIIVPVGGDLFNQDSSRGETTGGTPQDTDTRFPKLFGKTLVLMAEIIEEMRKHTDKVTATLTIGNHDENAATTLAYALGAWFRNTPDVVVDTLALKRKYYLFGKCLLCLGHFAEDGKQLPFVIPTEAAEMWGRARYREAHGGHLHRESVIDYGGFVLRRSPSIVSPDEWTHGKGFKNRARHITYIWHPERGMEETWIDEG